MRARSTGVLASERSSSFRMKVLNGEITSTLLPSARQRCKNDRFATTEKTASPLNFKAQTTCSNAGLAVLDPLSLTA